MTEPIWIAKATVMALHDRSLALHGGAAGLRDEGLLDSALDRPRNRFAYEGTEDFALLAATYGVGVSANHPFADGNKRAAFLCLTLFLRLNGMRLKASQADATRIIFDVAAGNLAIDGLADGVREHITAG